MKWLFAAGVLFAGTVLGSAFSAQVRKFLSKPNRSETQRELANPAGSIAFSVVLAVGLVGALGVASPEALKTLPKGFVSFVPKALVCILLIIVGNAVATLVAATVAGSILKATGKTSTQLPRVAKSIVSGAFAVLAISQLGVNTRIIDMLTAGIIFGSAFTIALLTVVGGRELAQDIASGRYLKRIIQVGDRIAAPDISGEVKALHGASVIVSAETSSSPDTFTFMHVPNRTLLNTVIRVERPTAPEASTSKD